MNYETARNIALKRDGVCQNCGAEENLHAHHIIPRREGGPDTPENLVILCKYCHPQYEGSDEIPEYAGEGYRVAEIVKSLTVENLRDIIIDEIREENDIFKTIQREPSICSNCFRRMPGIPSAKTRLEEILYLNIPMSNDDTPFDAIQEDPDICNNCFRRTHDRYERNYRLEVYFNDDEGEWDVHPVEVSGIEVEAIGGNGETEVIGGKPPEVTRRLPETDRIPERGGVRQMRTICECGFRYGPEEVIGHDWKHRPLPKHLFFEHAERLAERMHEKEVDFDEDEFFDILDKLKSDPDEQFADDRIYRKASKQASVLETVRS